MAVSTNWRVFFCRWVGRPYHQSPSILGLVLGPLCWPHSNMHKSRSRIRSATTSQNGKSSMFIWYLTVSERGPNLRHIESNTTPTQTPPAPNMAQISSGQPLVEPGLVLALRLGCVWLRAVLGSMTRGRESTDKAAKVGASLTHVPISRPPDVPLTMSYGLHLVVG